MDHKNNKFWETIKGWKTNWSGRCGKLAKLKK